MTLRLFASRTAARVTAKAALAGLLVAAAAPLAGCEKGEKSCRYYSMVMVAKGANLKKKSQQLEIIKSLPMKEQLKCDDPAVFERFAQTMETKELRPQVVATIENVGRASKSLRAKSEKLLVKALATEDTAGQAAQTIRTWRIETAESGRDPWFPSEETTKALADWLKKYKKETRAALVEALFVSLADNAARTKYEDLLIELAATDPGEQGLETNLKALAYLTEMYRAEPGKPKAIKDEAFDAFVKSLYTRDAVRAETFMAGRLALANIDTAKAAKKLQAVYTQKDPEFEKWAKEYGLADWEWKEGPKAIQILSDLHDPSTAADLVAAVSKAVDAETAPADYTIKNKQLPWQSYIMSRVQMTMWALASMGEGLAPVADAIGEVAKARGLTVEQRTLPFIALSIAGPSNGWASMLKAYEGIVDNEKPDFLTPLSYMVEPENMDEWMAKIAASKAEGVQKGLADAVLKARLNVTIECKKGYDAATDEPGKTAALVACYKGFLNTGDDTSKEKAAIGLYHLGVRKGAEVLPLLAEALNKAPATSTTLRQIIVSAFKGLAKPQHSQLVYNLKEAQVAVPNAQSWIWDLEVLTSQLLQKAGAVAVGNIPAVGSQVAPEKAADKPAAPGAAPAAPAAAPAAPAAAPAAPAPAPGK